jgi:4-hydroxybenzoate polyprenyltransferase
MHSIKDMNTSILYRCNLWLQERFPPINFISGFLLFLLARAVVDLERVGTATPLRWNDFFGILIPALHLFLLRVFDEHKDYETDKVHYPQRVIQRGIFGLDEVRILGFWAFGIQLVCFFTYGFNAASSISFLALWFWTLLMTKEFFIKDWLKQQLLLYGVLHLLITPILFYSLLVICAGELILTRVGSWALVLSLLTGWLYEISRKAKGAEEESGDLSYTQLWGVKQAMSTVAISTLFTSIISILFFRSLGLHQWYFTLGQIVILILALFCHWQFSQNPNAKNRKKNEGLTALISAYSFLTPIIFSWWP